MKIGGGLGGGDGPERRRCGLRLRVPEIGWKSERFGCGRISRWGDDLLLEGREGLATGGERV